MNIFDELITETNGGSWIVPLFDQSKTPTYTGWSEPDKWEAEAVDWMSMGHVISGRFLWMRPGIECIVFDPEGKSFGRAGYSLERIDDWPAWARLARNLATVLPSWSSAGGDGGLGIKNVLIPIGRDRLETLVRESAAKQVMPVPEGWRLSNRAQLAGAEWGEVLCQHGVCIPHGHVDGRELILSVDPVSGDPWSLSRAREVWSEFEEWVVHVLVEPLILGSTERKSVGASDSDAPVFREIEQALVWHGTQAAIAITHDVVAAGGSRHYACKSWAEYAYHGVKGRGGDEAATVTAGASSNVDDEISSRIIEQIWELWAHHYATGDEPFTPRDVRKAVIDSRRFIFGKRDT